VAGLGKRVAPLVAGTLVAAGLAVAPAYAVDAIDGPLTSGDSLFPNQGNGGYDVSHYDVDIAWNPGVPGGTITATTTIQATTTIVPLSSFGLDLEGLTVTSVKVDGQTAAFSRLDEPTSEPPGKHKLVITPGTPVTGTFTVEVAYQGIPSKHVDTDGSWEGWVPTSDGATFLNQPIGSMTGFPNNNTPKDKATYKFTLGVPEIYEAVSNGELESAIVDAGCRRWVWNQSRPMASELALVSIGQYDVLQSTVSLSGGRTVPEWSFVDSALSPGTKAAINTRRAELSTILTHLESLFGPYPGGSTGLVVDTVPSGINYALETQDRPFFPGGVNRGTLVHELTHQWYGDAVSPTVWNDLWINEGMATWAPVEESGSSTYDRFHGEWQNTPANDPDWTIPPVGITNTADLYGFQSYNRGAMTYEALRTLIGDAHFRTFIEQWQEEYDGESHGTADFIAMAEEVSGQALNAFFQDWLYDADKPAWPPAVRQPTDRPLAGRPLTNQPATTSTPPMVIGDTGGVCDVDDGPPPVDPPPIVPTPPTTPGALGAECQVGATGKARVGRKLTARMTGCPAPTAVSSYQWFAGGKPIAGADKATYKIKRSKLGKRISVRVMVSAPGYVTAERVSPPTKKVRR
jgi:hypothetical protein